MNLLSITGGVLLIIGVAYDFFYTTLSSNGAGVITHQVTHLIWRIFLGSSKAQHHKKIFQISGVCIILSLLTMWIGLLWLGLILILLGDTNAVVTSSTNMPATVLDKIYYSGYVLSTMGNGDFKPGNEYWQLLTVMFSFAGFIFITTAMTYLISVSSAVIHKKSLSLFISNLGDSPQKILLNAWNGADFSRLIAKATDLQQMLNKHTQNHMAYPILHYFHSGRKKDAMSVNLTSLDEALSIILLLFEQELETNEKDLLPLRDAIETYLKTLDNTFISAASKVEVLPDLSMLKNNNIKVISEESKIAERFQGLAQRRMLLAGLLHNNGWSWKDVYA